MLHCKHHSAVVQTPQRCNAKSALLQCKVNSHNNTTVTTVQGLSWPERPLYVVEHNLRGTKLHDHVWLMVVVGIDELERHWNEIGTRVVELGTHVDLRVAGIATGKFDNFDTTV